MRATVTLIMHAAAPTNGSATTTTTATAAIHKWNSPTPYLYASLALMLGLIAIALIILAYSYRKPSSNSSAHREEKSNKPASYVLQPEMEPKIVVIMAGDLNPTYLATHVAPNWTHN